MSNLALQYRKKYHEDSKKVSKVSVSLYAFIPVLGQTVSFQPGILLKALDDSVKFSISGSLTISGSSVIVTNLPTSDPSSAGQLYNDGGTLKISAG